MRHHIRAIVPTIAVLFTALLSSGCEISSDPGCVSDEECRAGRLCVDSQCVGEVEVANNGSGTNNGDVNNGDVNNGEPFNNGFPQNNGDLNNEPQNNGDLNNGDLNNEPQNNTDQNNGDQNNAPSACDTADECDQAQVCSWGDTSRSLQCVEPWTCQFSEGSGQGDECVFEWNCDSAGAVYIVCSPRPDGETQCACLNPENGQVLEFESDRDVCSRDYNDLVDQANVLCGFRIPLVVF